MTLSGLFEPSLTPPLGRMMQKGSQSVVTIVVLQLLVTSMTIGALPRSASKITLSEHQNPVNPVMVAPRTRVHDRPSETDFELMDDWVSPTMPNLIAKDTAIPFIPNVIDTGDRLPYIHTLRPGRPSEDAFKRAYEQLRKIQGLDQQLSTADFESFSTRDYVTPVRTDDENRPDK